MDGNHSYVRPEIEVVLYDIGTNWGAYAPGIPGVIATGATEEACRAGMEEALTGYFAIAAAEEAPIIARLVEEAEQESGADLRVDKALREMKERQHIPASATRVLRGKARTKTP